MSRRKTYENQMQARLEGLKSEIAKLRDKAHQVETNLELEYHTLLDELHLELEASEHKLAMLKLVNEEKWEEFRSELEHSWKSLRALITAITAP
jgi:predicted nuclease with TOPRIM domain